jgi:hypothetical protein
MPNRIIKESIRTSKTINALTDFQFRVWLYLITYVDDYGRGSADPEIIKGFVFPRRKRVTEADIAKALADLAGMGCILLYEVDGESYFCFPKWSQHQRIQTKRSKFPEPEDFGQEQNSTVGHGDSPAESESESETKNPNPESESLRTDARVQTAHPLPAEPFSGESVPYQEILDCYHAVCRSLPRVMKLTEARKKAVCAVWQAGHRLEELRQAFQKAESSDFLRGGGPRSWQAGFDWLMKEGNLVKLLEGQYDNHGSPQKGAGMAVSYDLDEFDQRGFQIPGGSGG